MGVKVAGSALNCAQPNASHSPSYSQALASAVSSPSTSALSNGMVRCVRKSSIFGAPTNGIYRSRSLMIQKPRSQRIKRACSASLDDFSDDEFSRQLQELVLRFQLSDDDDDESNGSDAEPRMVFDSVDVKSANLGHSVNSFPEDSELDRIEPPWMGSHQDWSRGEEIIPASIEWKANCVDLPLSLRIIKRKKQWGEGVKEVGEAAYCSVKKAFSSMVFIIRELHRYSLQMRELIHYEELQGILTRVQTEMHASFVWLFQQVFSPTPTLMVYVMMLLANYTVYSMGNSTALAAVPPTSYMSTFTESVSFLDSENKQSSKFDPSILKSFTVNPSSGKTASINGGSGGGGKFKQIANGTEGGDWFRNSEHQRSIMPDGISHLLGNSASKTGAASAEDTFLVTSKEEMRLWNLVVEEAKRMQEEFKDAALDHDTTKRFVSPVSAKVDEDDCKDYLNTELLYQKGIARDPNNPLLLANYAQFLFLVTREFERAEYYFKKATSVEPPDGEALYKYAIFLWLVKKDLWAAEETYQEAMAADPENSFYIADYAHFLWATGAPDTCYPLSSFTDDA
uniref:Tetratricopeptide repeat-like superfamily protein n=1 Tax=Kalanchoe fedtschenkoi TaxID=63787 RepID=A0A7N0TH62_KALFE